MEAYYCNIQVTEILDVQMDPKVMSVEDRIVAQSKDPTIRATSTLLIPIS